jgi:hypothetical protein
VITVAPVLADIDALPGLGIRARIRTLEAAQAQCRRDLDALAPRLALSGVADRLAARREEAQIVRAFAALARELRALGGP